MPERLHVLFDRKWGSGERSLEQLRLLARFIWTGREITSLALYKDTNTVMRTDHHAEAIAFVGNKVRSNRAQMIRKPFEIIPSTFPFLHVPTYSERKDSVAPWEGR